MSESSTRLNISEAINNGKILVSDGAWGTFLHAKGLKAGECPEEWNLSHYDDVFDIADSYVQAGSDIIGTNSFGGSRLKLANYKLEDRAAEINRAAAEISRKAAGTRSLVIGSVGPTGKILMMGDVTEKELYDTFAEQVTALAEGGCDAICVETMIALDEAVLAVKAARENTSLEVICTFTFNKTPMNEYRTMMGVTTTQMAEQIVEAGAHVIGTNCGNGIAGMIPIVKEFRAANKTVPILVHANAGTPVFREGKDFFPESPETTASYVKELVQAGAGIVGGCCGTTPDHIRAIKEVVSSLTP